MGRIAMISDIHANLEALQAVLADIDIHEISDIISLGDNVGYGPNPVEVLQHLYERQVLSLEGNHDLAVVNPKSFADATDLAIDAIEWTRRQLCEVVKTDEDFQNILACYFATPASYVLPESSKVLLVHGSPGDNKSRFDYLLSPEDFLRPAVYMKKKGFNICFFGHTHKQIFWEIDNKGVSLIDFTWNEPIEFHEKSILNSHLFINPGSVGQPRDNNPDAAYMIYEFSEQKHIFTFKRVSYNIMATVKKIYSVDLLDNALGDRLKVGI